MASRKDADRSDKARTRRVIVPVHAFGELRHLMQDAARIAASLDADLAVLLIEDENLHRMAALPFVQQVSLATAQRLPLESHTLDREIAAFARLAAATLADATHHAGISGKLETVRGSTASVLRSAAAPGDLLMIGAGAAAAGPARHLAVSAVAECWACDLLLHDLRPGVAASIVVCDDGSDIAARGLETAAALARAYRARLTIVDLDHHREAAPSGAAVKRVSDFDLVSMDKLLRDDRAAILVVPAPLADRIGATALVQSSPCAVLIVR